MGVHPFQIADLNWNFLKNAGGNIAPAGSFASEFGIFPDNVNASFSRYLKLQAVWADINIGAVVSSPNNDSYGQTTATSDSSAYRPNGGYFVRGLYFTNTAVPTNDSTGPFRVGYIGSFVGGILNCDYVHDANGSTVDYEPIYSHGAATWPMTASQAKQWRDPGNPPSDGTDVVTNSSSALTRTIYMPPAYQIMHIDSAGSQTLASGNVSFHVEERPTLHLVGFNDGINQATPNSPSWAGVGTFDGTSTLAYPSDPINGNNLNNSTQNFHELYQATGVRKLNSRGLSFHMAKVLDNSPYAFAYPYEEDGITLGTGVNVIGNNIQFPYTYVNDQQEYVWAGGRDKGANNLTTSVTSNVVTFTFNAIPTPFPTGATVFVQGLTNHPELNGALLVVLAGATTTSFTANWTHADYAAIADNGAVVYQPDYRIREKATFIINEEYYGTVMDTKCAIWSNKASMVPLIFFDLADTWSASTAKRIAGVASVPVFINATATQAWQVFFLAEDGKLARYDFTQTNGVLELAGTGSFAFASNAPAVSAAGEAYGALKARTTASTITNVAITTNVLTIQCTNTFEPGEIINLTGLTTATFLNNQTVTVSTASGSQFTAAYTHANYSSAADTGTALGYSLWALYGTMTPTPRVQQTGLANDANINVYRYLIGTGAWGTKITSPLKGRHNGRSLNEMIVSRNTNTNPSCLYMLVEDVTSSAGFNVSNSYSAAGTATTGTSVSITSNVATVQAVNSFVAGETVLLTGFASAAFFNNIAVTVLSTGLSGTQFEFNFVHANYGPTGDSGTITPQANVNWQLMAYDPTAATWNTTKVNGAAPNLFQYGNNFGTPAGQTFSETRDYWFHAVNAALFDIGPNQILIQPNWTAGSSTSGASTTSIGLQVLDVSGTTAGLTNSNLSNFQRSTILPNDTFIGAGGSQTEPAIDPVTIVHARDFATNGERTVFWFNDFARSQVSTMPLYLAPPSFNWASPTALSLIQRNSYPGGAPPQIGSFQKDFWSYSNVQSMLGQFTVRYAWQYPTMLTDNYIHYILSSGGGVDGLPTSSTYGRAAGQSMGFLPTYWKFTGGNWKMADSWADAAANPHLISAANTNITLPYGLQVQFGLTGASSYTNGEFHTFNMCYGNTKFARKMRQSYAQFAGQTFINQDTRTVATQNALSTYLIDTDLGTVVNTAPTSATPQTATLTNRNSWVTQYTWNKLDGANAGFDATPYTTVWNVNSSAFNTSTFAFPAAANVTGTGPGPYSWTVGATTYQVQASGEQNPSTTPAWFAVAGNPQAPWVGNVGNSGTLAVDLGSAKTVNTYGFRPVFTSADTLDGSVPKSWTLEGSATGLSGPWTIVDTRGPITSFNRGVVFTVASPGSFRYYRMNISATQSGGNAPSLQMFRLNTSALQTTVNFSELAFYAYGSTVSATYHYQFIRNWQMARGIKLEVSTNNGGSYTTVFAPGGPSPLWRSFNGYVFTFNRQVGVTNVRITCQHGYNYATQANSGNQPTTTGFGPFYFIDYGDGGGAYGSDTTQATINAARLGSSVATNGTPARGSFDPNCLGVATDTPNISIDGSNPSLIAAANTLTDTSVHGFWDFSSMSDAAHNAGTPLFKVHPFFGFIYFQGAGADGSVSTQTGTNVVVNYQWGRRV